MENIEFYNKDIKLEGTIFTPSNLQAKHPAILFVHGWTSARARSFQYTEALVKLGYICFLFDMRGHGTSTGDRNLTTGTEFLTDILTAYDYLAEMITVDKENINVVGSSFGGYLITLLTKQRKVSNLVLRAPAEYPDDILETPKKIFDTAHPDILEWRVREKGSSFTRAHEALSKFEGNVLLIESENDERIPHQAILNYMNAVKNQDKVQHALLKNAPHSIKDGPFKDEVERILVGFFTSAREGSS